MEAVQTLRNGDLAMENGNCDNIMTDLRKKHAISKLNCTSAMQIWLSFFRTHKPICCLQHREIDFTR